MIDFLKAVGYTFLFSAVVLLCISFVGCGEPYAPLCEPPATSSVSPTIVNGEPSTDRRSTVLVYMPTGWCSGTIVGPHSVLTAAHCKTPPFTIEAQGIGQWTTEESLRHPDYAFPQHDMRLLYFDEVLPEPYAMIGLRAGVTCSSLLAQGYGRGSNGALHERVVIESSRQFGILRTSPATCPGDSGGPLWGMNTISGGPPVLVGVTSFGTADECTISRPGFVDLQQDMNAFWVRDNVR